MCGLFHHTARYSFRSRAIASGEGWILVHLDIHTTPSFSIEYRQWTRRIYEDALQAAGFQDVRWHPLELSSEGLAKFGTLIGSPSWKIHPVSR
jgi:hypothetical protein